MKTSFHVFKGITLGVAAETIGVAVAIVSPAYIIACVPRTSRHLNRYLPVYFGGSVLATTSAFSICSLLSTLEADNLTLAKNAVGMSKFSAF